MKTEKLYPVARWEYAQHKIEYFHVKAHNAIDEFYLDNNSNRTAEDIEKIEKFLERVEGILDIFYPADDGLVYLPYRDYKFVRALIARYNAVH